MIIWLVWSTRILNWDDTWHRFWLALKFFMYISIKVFYVWIRILPVVVINFLSCLNAISIRAWWVETLKGLTCKFQIWLYFMKEVIKLVSPYHQSCNIFPSNSILLKFVSIKKSTYNIGKKHLKMKNYEKHWQIWSSWEP